MERGINRPIIFDRALPDIVGYAKLFGLDTKDYELKSKYYRYYSSVFVFPPWREIYCNDEERKMSFEDSVKFHELLANAYRESGYNCIDVPLTSLKKRAQFIIESIKNLN